MLVRARLRALVLVAAVTVGVGLLTTVLPAGTAGGAVTPNCGTGVYYRADGSRLSCVFSDYFGGTSLNTAKWTVLTSSMVGVGAGGDCFVNSRYNYAVNNGVLKMVTRRGLAPFTCGSGSNARRATATSVEIATYKKFNLRYGRVEIRARFPYTTHAGLQTSLWLWPSQGVQLLNPTSEIDTAEWYSKYYDRVIPYLHYSPWLLAAPSPYTNTACRIPNVGNWHTYVLTWTASQIVISYDGRECLRNTSGNSAFQQPFFLVLTQMLGVGDNAPTGATPLRAMTQIDYVRAWS